MSLPIPPVPLKNHCSVINNNTLYTYQPDAFQSLGLEEGRSWLQLPMGVAVTGASCLQGMSNGQEVLYIVGGTPNASTPDYPGLQYYSFANNNWTNVTPLVPVTQDRLRHGAAYLNSSSMILVYAGSQNGDWTPSSETFLISTIPPYAVTAFSSYAPPVVSPILLSYNQSHAVVVGVGSQNKNVFTFGPQDQWQKLDATLQTEMKNSSSAQAAIVSGTDGSKVLEVFDMSESPNQITTALLQTANSTPTSGQQTSTPTSSPPTATHVSTTPRRRDISIANWPAYNSTLAPQITRNGFSLAQSPGGLVVISGGTDDSNPLCIFNQDENQWVNATQFFGERSPAVPTPSSTGSPVASLTATASPSSSSGAAASNGNVTRIRYLTILGATLGAVFGLAVLLILALCLLCCLRRRRRKLHGQSRSSYANDSKNNMDFADQGAEFMSEAGGSLGHRHQNSGNSATSEAIMFGRATVGSPQSKRGFFHKPGDSEGSAKSFFSRTKSPLAPSPRPISHGASAYSIGREVVALASPEARTEPRADTGWSKYFTNNSTTNLANIPAGYARHDSNSRPTTYTSTSQSDYTSGSGDPHESAEVPPLNIRSSQQGLASFPMRDRSSSPPLGRTGVALTKEASPVPSTPSSLHTDDVSDLDEDDHGYQRIHGPQSEGMASWTPVATSDRGSTWEERPASSIYADSVIYPHPGEKVRIPNFPGVPSSARNSQVEHESGLKRGPSVVRDFAAAGPVQPPPRAAQDPGSHSGDDQYIKRFPRKPLDPDSEATDNAGHYGQRRGNERGIEDMSWLNLGK